MPSHLRRTSEFVGPFAVREPSKLHAFLRSLVRPHSRPGSEGRTKIMGLDMFACTATIRVTKESSRASGCGRRAARGSEQADIAGLPHGLFPLFAVEALPKREPDQRRPENHDSLLQVLSRASTSGVWFGR